MNTLPPEVADAFRLAAITALQELVQLEGQWEDASPEFESNPAVIATMQLLGESRQRKGRVSLALSATTGAKLAVRYLPPGTATTAEMVDDVAGEFANVIAGQAKTMLKGTPYHFQLTTPTVTRAKSPFSTTPASAIHFSTELGTICLLIEFS